jgi:DNA replication and repair protein RecF
VLFLDRVGGDARLRYARALKARQRVLEERGSNAPELDAIETVAASSGARLCRARALAAGSLAKALSEAFEKLSSSRLQLSTRYLPGGATDEAEFESQLGRRRDQDRLRRSASFGPQRDDLGFSINGRTAKHYASQGQQRLLTLSVKMAELSCVAEAGQVEPILLLDDVSSELDPERTGAVYDFLYGTKSQVFVTTTRPELFVTPSLAAGERADFVLRDGEFS